jgi:oligo-1,6-glucosidase
MTNAPWASIEDFRDIESLNHYAEAVAAGQDPADVLDVMRAKSRDNARTPMQWDATANAGFTGGTPWLAVNPNFADINAAAQVDDPDSVFSHYRRLIELRHTLPVIAEGDFTPLAEDHPQIYAYARRLGDDELRVVANLSSEPAEWDGEQLAPWEARVQLPEPA